MNIIVKTFIFLSACALALVLTLFALGYRVLWSHPDGVSLALEHTSSWHDDGHGRTRYHVYRNALDGSQVLMTAEEDGTTSHTDFVYVVASSARCPGPTRFHTACGTLSGSRAAYVVARYETLRSR